MGNIPFSGADSWVLTNYCADFPANVRDYVLHTGDRAILPVLQPCLERLLTWLLTDCSATDERAASAPFWEVRPVSYFTDNTISLSSRVGLCTQLFDGFRALEQLGLWLDDDAFSRRSRTGRDFIAAQFKRHLVNPADGSLRDQATRDEQPIVTCWHAPAFAAFAGLLEAAAGRRELQRAMQAPDAPKTASGFCEFLLVDALFALGLPAEAIAEMERYWGTMLDAGLTTCPEATDGTQAFYAGVAARSAPLSYCHGWSGGPAYLLPARVLGVRPVAPGYQSLVIEPNLGGLQWAKGRHPTPLGDLELAYERTAQGLEGRITLPANIRATLHTGNPSQPLLTLKNGSNSIRLPD